MWRRSELQLAGDATRRAVPLIVAAMVYLATLTLAGTLAVDGTVQTWGDGLRGALTVQLPGVAGAPEGAEAQARIDTALALLLETPGVLRATPLPDSASRALLEPWLGAGNLPPDLAIPILIDVRIDPAGGVDFDRLAQRLDEVVPGTQINDNGLFLQRLVRLARSVQAVGVLVVLIVALAAISIVVLATRTGMVMHRETIELLHLIGARDSYIARQFVAHALILGLLGGVLGLALAAATLGGLALVAGGIRATLLPNLALQPQDWIAILSIPLVSAAVATLTARLTVMRALRRIL